MAMRETQREAIPGRIIARAERLIDRGNNLFMARSTMANAAIWMFLDDYQDVQAVHEEANAGIIRALAARGAEGMVFADRMDLGNGYQDSTDFVAVTARNGARTLISPEIYGELIIRDATPQAEIRE